jgi:hypothetical protein
MPRPYTVCCGSPESLTIFGTDVAKFSMRQERTAQNNLGIGSGLKSLARCVVVLFASPVS